MNYQEAEQRFHGLEQQLSAGQITMDQYRTGLNELRVTDSAGRLWMPQERTGAWYVYLDGQWQPASAVQNPPQPSPAYAPQSTPIRPAQQASQATGGGLKLGVTLIIWFVIFLVVAVVAFLVSKDLTVLLIVGLVALFSLIAILLSAASAWEGEVIDNRTETRRTRDSNGHYHTRIERYAILRQPNGKTKKVSTSGNWNIGDYLVKRRGELAPRIVPKP
ncbi:MAG: hypothetical protein ACYCZF_11240 [Anaerolineae bacterium]